MIRYSLVCAKGHSFESWFQNSAAYEKQAKRSLVTCPVCGDAKVEKAIMAPNISSAKRNEPAPVAAPLPPSALSRGVDERDGGSIRCRARPLQEVGARHGLPMTVKEADKTLQPLASGAQPVRNRTSNVARMRPSGLAKRSA